LTILYAVHLLLQSNFIRHFLEAFHRAMRAWLLLGRPAPLAPLAVFASIAMKPAQR